MISRSMHVNLFDHVNSSISRLVLSREIRHHLSAGVELNCHGIEVSAQGDEPSGRSNSTLSRSNRKEEKARGVPQRADGLVLVRYKIVISILLIFLIMAGLLFFQQANVLQLQNRQLSSRSSDLTHSLSDLNRIVNMQVLQVLEDNLTILVPAGVISLNLTCPCFQYSGFLQLSWRSSAHIMLRVAQFGLNLTTPSVNVGAFRIAVSSSDPFVASFVATGCPIREQCTATYSAVYRY